jgi:hypothetical protein
MDLLAVSINAIVVAVVGGIVAWLGKGRFEAIVRRFEAVDRRFDRLEARLDGRIDSLEARLDAMRSDLTQVALAVGVRPRAQND